MNGSDPAMHEGIRGRGAVLRVLLFVAIAALCLALSALPPLRPYFHVESISRLARQLGLWGPLLILALGIVSPLLFLPRWPIALVSGLVYGVLWGSLLANVASTLGAWLHFVLARTLLRPLADRLRQRYGVRATHLAPSRLFVALLLLRAFPLSNFVATNLLAGAAGMRAAPYVLASFLGMIPSTLMYAVSGKLMKKPSPEFYALAVLVVLVLVVGSALAQKRFLPWFRKQEEQESPGPAAEETK